MFTKCKLRWYPPWVDVFGVKVRAGPRMGRLASRRWFRVAGQVRAKQPLDGGAVFHRVEAKITVRPPEPMFLPLAEYRVVCDTGVDFQVDGVRIVAADLEPIFRPAPMIRLHGAFADQVLRRALEVIPDLRSMLEMSISGRELSISPGDLVEVRGARHEEIDPTGDARSYREPPTRIVLRAPREVPALIFAPRTENVR